MLYYKDGNLLDAPQRVIAHQVNCRGVMGSGIAKEIKVKYPKVYSQYREYVDSFRSTYGKSWRDYAGAAQYIEIDESRVVVNLFGQVDYGRDGKRYTSYAYLTEALLALFDILSLRGSECFAVPYNMGCGLGGADWGIVESILGDLSDRYNIDVYIYKL